jgi:hypothetical protein
MKSLNIKGTFYSTDDNINYLNINYPKIIYEKINDIASNHICISRRYIKK